ncbi:hypothetical protein BH18THE2_BH18THE2_05480 [soil metagenome]
MILRLTVDANSSLEIPMMTLSPSSNALESKAKCPICSSSKVPPVATRLNLSLVVRDRHLIVGNAGHRAYSIWCTFPEVRQSDYP